MNEYAYIRILLYAQKRSLIVLDDFTVNANVNINISQSDF